MSVSASFAIKTISLLLATSTLAACNQITAQPSAPRKPVLVAAVHYQPQVPDRSFVGTVRPRIESDLGFRVTGKIQKRLVEVGTLVVAGQAPCRCLAVEAPSRSCTTNVVRPSGWPRSRVRGLFAPAAPVQANHVGLRPNLVAVVPREWLSAQHRATSGSGKGQL